MTPTKNLTPNDIALDLGISVRQVLAEIRKRRLRPVIRISRKTILIEPAAFAAYKQSRTL